MDWDRLYDSINYFGGDGDDGVVDPAEELELKESSVGYPNISAMARGERADVCREMVSVVRVKRVGKR